MATGSIHETRVDIPEELFEGNRLDQPTFHRLYEQTPDGFKAELIGGIVYVASPVGISHSDYHGVIATWLNTYAYSFPSTHALFDATIKLGEESEPQPDTGLRYRQGTSYISDNYCVGPPELVVEISDSTAAHDLVSKRADYERHGVAEYLVVVASESQAVWFGRGDNGGFVKLSPSNGILRSRVFPGLWLDPEALFRLDHEQVMAVLNEGLAAVGGRES